MKRITHLTLSLGTVALLALLLILAVGAQPTALADGNTIKVPGDYPTIQGAIDAATDGDEILVASGLYKENLSITGGIALSGGWNDDFTTRSPGNTGINGNGAGRVISITCPTSDTVVTIDGFTIFGGDASGLGIPELFEIPEIPASQDLPYGSRTPAVVPAFDSVSPTEQVEQLRAGLADLAAQGLYPSGEPAYQSMLARLERLTARAEEALARGNETTVQQQNQSQQGTGSGGGGIYSYNASLQLMNNWIMDNLANKQGNGLGGGVFVTMAPPGGVRIASNTFAQNVAAGNGTGAGGGLYVTQAPGAIIGNNNFNDNVASQTGDGFGGGIYVFQASGTSIQDNMLTSNLVQDGANR